MSARVSFNRKHGKWRAYAGRSYLGQFPTRDEAWRVACAASNEPVGAGVSGFNHGPAGAEPRSEESHHASADGKRLD